MTITVLIWMVASIFILHDFEEIITVEGWLSKNKEDVFQIVPKRFHQYINQVLPRSTAGFSVAVLVEYIGIVIVTFLAIFGQGEDWTLLGILSVVTILFIHSFTHIGQFLYFKRYTPGVVTSIILVIPFSIYFFYYTLSRDFIDWAMIWWSFPIGFVLMLILNQVGLALGKIIEFK
ncbi:HXXEE domain-containing protein [Neobacillus dielmonensis]|uniref:HXXEE domain-containing protein n=1 Tax=Neobacillus dielmonensis TaxID=1347369 RepID=UPI000693B865|nr:HXXEE domain-containing protein [Neobacillus dielmonensis]